MGSSLTGRHVSASVAIDVARGVMEVTSDPRLARHLSACDPCRAKLNTWKAFSALAAKDSRHAPSEAALARVHRLAEQRRPVSGLTVIKAALGYDSGTSLELAGVRGAYVPEQVAYEGEGIAVELNVREEAARQLVIVGQIHIAGEPKRHLADLPVILVEGNEVKVRALSNSWGEFHLEHPRRDRLRLEVGVPGGRIVRIPLRREPRES